MIITKLYKIYWFKTN